MTTETTESKPSIIAAIAPALAASLGKALRTSVEAARNSGNMLSDFIAACVGGKLPDVVPDATADAIAFAAYPDSFSPNADVLKARRSDARAIVRSHAKLAEGMEALKAATGDCKYTPTIAMARRLAKGESVTAAVTAVAGGKSVTVDHDDRFERAVKSYHKALVARAPRTAKSKTEKAERLALIETLAATLKIELAK